MYDQKQLRLISSWIALSGEPGRDVYSRFISLWIAFNAACYARYSKAAQRNRADLRNEKGLSVAPEGSMPARGELVRAGTKVKIDLQDPGRIVIQISERYIEEVIFDEFAHDYQAAYETWLDDPTMLKELAVFQEAIRKPNGHCYVVNMARASQHDVNQYENLRGTNVIATLDDPRKLRRLKDVLYQVRCNIFHGEKVPGELNDDRIASAALPLLSRFVQALVTKTDG